MFAIIGSPTHRQLLRDQRQARDAYHAATTTAERHAAEARVTAAAAAIRDYLKIAG